jgi:hypothetical protein
MRSVEETTMVMLTPTTIALALVITAMLIAVAYLAVDERA